MRWPASERTHAGRISRTPSSGALRHGTDQALGGGTSCSSCAELGVGCADRMTSCDATPNSARDIGAGWASTTAHCAIIRQPACPEPSSSAGTARSSLWSAWWPACIAMSCKGAAASWAACGWPGADSISHASPSLAVVRLARLNRLRMARNRRTREEGSRMEPERHAAGARRNRGGQRTCLYISSSSSSYIASASSGPALIAEVAQCFRWLRMSSRPTPRSASCTDAICTMMSAQ